MRPLSARERRLIAVGLLLLAIAGVYLLVLQPLVGGFFDRAAERRRLEAELKNDGRIVAALPTWRAAAEAQRRTASRFALGAPSDSLAGEALKDRLEHLAADEGYALNAVEDLPADASAGTTRVRADMTLSLTQLTDSIRRLENEGAYVVVDYLAISADEAFVSRRLAPVRVRLELSAAHRPAPGPRSP